MGEGLGKQETVDMWKRYSLRSYAVLNMMTWVGFIGQLRYSSNMRRFWSLVKNCVRDMSNFLVFMMVFTLAFATTYFFEQHTTWTNNGTAFADILVIQYRLWYGDWDPEIADPKKLFLFMLFTGCTLLMALVMTNLLIALMSATFERVYDSFDISSNKEQNSLILEIETFMFCNRGEGKRSHLLFVEYDEDKA